MQTESSVELYSILIYPKLSDRIIHFRSVFSDTSADLPVSCFPPQETSFLEPRAFLLSSGPTDF